MPVQVGDGTTTVVILSGELLRAAKPFVEEGVHPRVRAGAAALVSVLVYALMRHHTAGFCNPTPSQIPHEAVASRCKGNSKSSLLGAPSCPDASLLCCAAMLAAPLQSIIRSYRQACALAVSKVKELSVSLEGKSDEEKRDLLVKCAATSLNSKLVRQQHATAALLPHSC